MAGIALLGAGIFAKEQHLPAIQTAASSGLATLKAVYSRSQASAEALAASTNDSSVAVYFDTPSVPGKSLDDLLNRADISAVVVALPILNQPSVIQKSLKAGKHVLSEKPISKDVETAKQLLTWYESELTGKKPIWSVAENFRYYKSLKFASDKIAEVGGQLVTFRLQSYGFIRSENKYLNTEWRKVPDYQGGFLLDGGVHFVAALRMLLGAAGGQEVTQVVAFSGLLEERLPPVDTLHAVAVTKDGKTGTIGLSFGTEFKSGLEVEIVTTKGSVEWNPRQTKVTVNDKNGEKVETKEDFEPDSGVKAEVEAFVRAIAAGKEDPLQSPIEALKDLEIVQSLLESGDAGAAVKKIGN